MKQHQQSFRAVLPPATHRRAASCEEVDCPHYLNGWLTIVGSKTPQAHYIRTECGREFTETAKEGDLVEFAFPPGQTCFREHTMPTGRPPIYIHETPAGRRVHKKGEDWVEDFAGELDKVRADQEALA